MAALVASPLVLPSRDKKEDGPPSSSMFSTTQTTEQGLSRFTNNPITFVKASDPPPSSVPLSSKYEVLDDSKLSPPDVSKSPPTDRPFIGPLLPSDKDLPSSPHANSTTPRTAAASSTNSPPLVPTKTELPTQLWTVEIPNTFPSLGSRAVGVARGLDNVGNTCFLNSVLQCLLHTPQLLHVALQHSRDKCKDCPKGEFCMIKAFGETAWQALYATDSRPYIRPTMILGNLGKFAKGLRRGRQEDAHEFLRYSIDAFQRAALAGTDPKLPHSVKETTWVHKLFGGRLRSRVTCQSCDHPSDTFDSLLDLSIDIHRKESVRDALDAFVAIERLAGADKYNCEKCKKPVVAEKQFTIHDAPQILTVHLKRFTPIGRKLTQPVKYGEQLSLARYMSQGQHGPTYTLYGIICHAGSGPNSGHYYAHVKSAKGVWHEMNDESVNPVRSAPLGLKNAYILFYMQTPGSALRSAIQAPASTPPQPSFLAAPAEIVPAKERAQKKRSIPQDDDDEDLGEKAPPLAPSNGQLNQSLKRPKLDSNVVVSDPAAIALKAKIMAATANPRRSRTPNLLPEYEGQSSDTEVDLGPSTSTQTTITTLLPSSFTTEVPTTPPSTSHLSIPSLFPAPPPSDAHVALTPIPTTDSTLESDRTGPAAVSHSSERAYGTTGESSRKSRHSSDENDRSSGGSDSRRSGSQFRHHPYKRKHGHHREKLMWRVGGFNHWAANALRDNLHDDRNAPSFALGWHPPVEQTKKHRMNKKKRS